MNFEISELARSWIDWAIDRATSTDTMVQFSFVMISFVVALILARPTRAALDHVLEGMRRSPRIDRTGNLIRLLIPPFLWLVLLGGVSAAGEDFGYGNGITRNVASLLGAWIIIRLSSTVLSEAFSMRAALPEIHHAWPLTVVRL